MKSLLKATLLSSLFVLASCSHFGYGHGCADKSQCDMHKENCKENCKEKCKGDCVKKEQCDMKKEASKETAPATKK